ncbi:MAG TPA: FAD-dependent oxidoreductase [Anaeromyxobacteraceae bacterium]
MTSPRRFDVLVIGAGIAGASVAAELASRRRVVVLEMEEQPGYHTTGRSAAVFAECYGNRLVRALTRASRAFLTTTPPGDEVPLLVPRGWLSIARRDQMERLGDLEREILANGGTVQPVSEAEARALVPILRRGHVAAALLDQSAMDVDVHALHQLYLRRLRAAGGETITGARAVALDRAGRDWKVHTTQGDFAAPLVIDAAGAWADEVGRLAGATPIGLVPMRRTALILDLPRGTRISSWPLVVDADESFYFKPEGGRLLASPADETPSPPCDARPEDLDVAVAIDRITAACELEVSHVSRRWAGLRSFVADRSPVAGFDPRAPGFFWLAGQGGYGIQTAPALSRLAAALALGEPVPADLAAEGVSAAQLAPGRLAESAFD